VQLISQILICISPYTADICAFFRQYYIFFFFCVSLNVLVCATGWESLHLTDFFFLNLTFEYFCKSVKKMQVLFKSDNNNGHEGICTFMIQYISLKSSQN